MYRKRGRGKVQTHKTLNSPLFTVTFVNNSLGIQIGFLLLDSINVAVEWTIVIIGHTQSLKINWILARNIIEPAILKIKRYLKKKRNGQLLCCGKHRLLDNFFHCIKIVSSYKELLLDVEIIKLTNCIYTLGLQNNHHRKKDTIYMNMMCDNEVKNRCKLIISR